MYVPPHFRIEDTQLLADFIARHSFGTLITDLDGSPFATHIPFLFEPPGDGCGRLYGHIARSNPQRESLEAGCRALAVFTGPHAYISPAWYRSSPAVPTWNYMAAHVYGAIRAVGMERLLEILRSTVVFYEQSQRQPWQFESLPAEYVEKMARAVIGFEIQIEAIEGKFKLSQNRSREDIESAVQRLEMSGDPGAQELARQMREHAL